MIEPAYAYAIVVTFTKQDLGGSPGLVVMERDSCSKGCGFESHHMYSGWTLFAYICCKN